MNQAKALVSPGTFVVISAGNPSTSYIRVSGKIVPVNPTKPESGTILTNIAYIPVDSSGNSLAGESEVTLEAAYNAFDQQLFGTNRGGKIGSVNVPSSYQTSFVCGCDLEDMGAQVPGWVDSQFGITQIPVGTVVTLVFQDKTTAQFVKFSGMGTFQWKWDQIAHNSKGALIDQYGNLIVNPSTSGRGGGQFGSGPSNGGGSYSASGGSLCVSYTQVSWGNEDLGSETHLTPC